MARGRRPVAHEAAPLARTLGQAEPFASPGRSGGRAARLSRLRFCHIKHNELLVYS